LLVKSGSIMAPTPGRYANAERGVALEAVT
jgi:hypothetical protein